jgi:hypothetical protein
MIQLLPARIQDFYLHTKPTGQIVSRTRTGPGGQNYGRTRLGHDCRPIAGQDWEMTASLWPDKTAGLWPNKTARQNYLQNYGQTRLLRSSYIHFVVDF